MSDKRFYTVNDLMHILDVGRTTLHHMRKRGEIPGEIRRGPKRVLFFAPIIDRWIQDRVAAGAF